MLLRKCFRRTTKYLPRVFSSMGTSQEFGKHIPDPGQWRNDPQFQQHKKKVRAMRGTSRKMYILFFSPFKKPVEFISQWTMCFITLVYAFNMQRGESMTDRKHSTVKRQLLHEAGLSENDVDEIESFEVPGLSEKGAAEYARVMDQYLEPREGKITAWLLGNPAYEHANAMIEEDPRISRHQALIGLEQLNQKEYILPAEIRENMSPEDHGLIKQLLLNKEIDSKLHRISMEEKEEVVKLPRRHPSQKGPDSARINRGFDLSFVKLPPVPSL